MRLVEYKLDPSGMKVAFVEEKRKLLHCVMMENSGLMVKKVPISEERHMTDIENYSHAKAARIMRGFGKSHGSTKAARRLLRGI